MALESVYSKLSSNITSRASKAPMSTAAPATRWNASTSKSPSSQSNSGGGLGSPGAGSNPASIAGDSGFKLKSDSSMRVGIAVAHVETSIVDHVLDRVVEKMLIRAVS